MLKVENLVKYCVTVLVVINRKNYFSLSIPFFVCLFYNHSFKTKPKQCY